MLVDLFTCQAYCLYGAMCLDFILVIVYIYISVAWKKPQLLSFQFSLAALQGFFWWHAEM